MIYFDYAATSPPESEFLAEFTDMLQHDFYNPGSNYRPAKAVKAKSDQARTAIANCFNVSSEDLYFCSSATLASNIIINGYCQWLKLTSSVKNEIILSEIEHPAVFQLGTHLSNNGFTVHYTKVDKNGQVDLDSFTQLLNPNTAIVAIMSVNNETGSIQPINQLVKLSKAYDEDIFFISDFVQALGKCHTDVLSNVDAWFISGHKIGAPKGTACFYVNPQYRLVPTLYGGGQEQGLFPGTECPAMHVALANCAAKATTQRINQSKHATALKQQFLLGLKKNHIAYHLSVDSEAAIPNIISITFERLDGQAMSTQLEGKGILVSTRSACSSNHSGHSHVIQALQAHHEPLLSPIRISFSHHTTSDEVDHLLAALKEITDD